MPDTIFYALDLEKELKKKNKEIKKLSNILDVIYDETWRIQFATQRNKKIKKCCLIQIEELCEYIRAIFYDLDYKSDEVE